MPMSVPGNSCRPCNNTGTTTQGCSVRVPWECVYYTGPRVITNFTLNTGDNLNTFATNLLTYGLYQDSGTIDFTSNPLSAKIKVSTSPGNALSALPDGLFAEGLSLTAVNNGLSMSTGNIAQLGNDVGIGSAALLNNREIPLTTFGIKFLASSGQVSTRIDGTGVTFNQTGSSSTARVYCTSNGSLLVNDGTKDIAQFVNSTGDIYITGNKFVFNSDNAVTPSKLDLYLKNITFSGVDRFMSLRPSQFSTYIGYGAGANVADPPPLSNVAVGHFAMQNVTAFNNTALGSFALQTLSSGTGNIGVGQGAGFALTTGSHNTFIGSQANRINTQSNNTFIGQRTGMPPDGLGDASVIASETVLLGYATGQGNLVSNPASTLNSCIMIGNRNGVLAGGNVLTNTTVIGHDTHTPLSNVCILGSFTQNILIGQGTTDNGNKLQVSGNVSISGISTSGSAPATSGTTKMVITDTNGRLSFANIPSSVSYAIIPVVSTNFNIDGVTYANPSLNGRTFEIFFNDLNRYIYNEVGNQEWDYAVGGGFVIMIPGFNANTNSYHLYISPKT